MTQAPPTRIYNYGGVEDGDTSYGNINNQRSGGFVHQANIIQTGS